MKVSKNELVLITEGIPGSLTFQNYEMVKEYLRIGLADYNGVVYSADNMEEARQDLETLKGVKKKLDDKKKELQKQYNKPYVDVEKQIDELIKMVKVPLDIVDKFIKDTEKAAKRQEILDYAAVSAKSLGEFSEKVLASQAFFNERWLNKTYKAKDWHSDIDSIVRRAADDIRTIHSDGGKNTGAMLGFYFDKLSMEGMQDFLKNLNDEDLVTADVDKVEDEDKVIGFKTLKLYGTQRQMLRVMTQLDLMEIEYEELEDGMPGSMTEIKDPGFDSFISFDIEHTGTFGYDKGDADPEIIEIGAVKVIDGQIVEKFDELANPGRKIVPRISRLTHITDDMVADKPPVDEVIRRFREFVGDNILIGHNIKGCDIPHITRAAKRAGVSFENPYLDTKELALSLRDSKGWKNVKLTTLSSYYGIVQNEAHRALCDAEANALLFLKLKDEY